MNREQLIHEFYHLTDTEKERLETANTAPSSYYQFLEKNGYLEKNGIYHMPSIFLSAPAPKTEYSFWNRVDYSPYQSLFRLKKASRFVKEPLSYADFLSIRYVYSGEDRITTPSTDFTLGQNDLCLMNAGFVCSQYLKQKEDIVFTFMFEKDYLVKNVIRNQRESSIITRFIYDYVLASKNPNNYIIFHGKDSDKLPRLLEDIVMEYAHPTSMGELLLEAYLQILLVEMTHFEYEFEKTKNSLQTIHFAEILQEIEDSYATVSLSGLAKKYGYNPDYISRRIQKITGKSYKDHLLETRMGKVCQLLKNSSLPIQEIMIQCGFTSETYFYKKFKELFHMTPHAYRKQ